MSIELAETLARWIGGVATVVFLAVAFEGVWRSFRHPHGRATGWGSQLLRAPSYVIVSALSFGACWWLWRPIQVSLNLPQRAVSLIAGTVFYFSGIALWLWGRWTLGAMFSISSSLGVQLYADHQLITGGPFAYTRHPMYLGILTAACGSILLYQTWATLLVTFSFLSLVLRARREEAALAEEFKDERQAYCRRVPAWLPRLRRQTYLAR